MLLTGLAWGIATTTSAAAIIRLALIYVFVHFLAISLLVATIAYFLVGRLLGPGIPGLPGRRRQQGLFTAAEDREQLEFGYCFDVSDSAPHSSCQAFTGDADFSHKVAIRAFFPMWVLLYVVQFVLWQVIKRDYWYGIHNFDFGGLSPNIQ